MNEKVTLVGCLGLIVAILALIGGFVTPEVRCFFRLDKCPTGNLQYLTQLQISSLNRAGISFRIPETGDYVFEYAGGAWSAWTIPEGGKECNPPCYVSGAVVYRGINPTYNNEHGLSDENRLAVINPDPDVRRFSSFEEAENAAMGERRVVFLEKDDWISIVVADGEYYFSDNRGDVFITIHYVRR